MSGVIAKLARPQLRGHLTSSIKKDMAIAIALGLAASISYKVFVSDRRKQRYADFYKNYDLQKEFERMRQAGVFNCAPADE